MNLFTLMATVGLDTTGFSKGVGQAIDEGKKMGERLKKIAGVATKVTGAVLVAGATAYVKIVKDAMGQVGELEQNLGGAKAVWADFSDDMVQIAQGSAQTVGLATSDYLATANKMGSIIQGVGFSQEEAFNMTNQAMQRASDVASVLGLTAEEGILAVTNMMKGETQMMDNLGVSMTETALQAYAVEKGIRKSTAKMTEQEKALLRLEMFMERTAYAAGNYAAENESLAGSAEVLRATWDNLLDDSGTPQEFADALSTYVTARFEAIKEIAPRIASALSEVAQRVGQKANEWLEGVGGWKGAAKIALDWALGQFNAPSVDEIKTQVSNWWNGVSGENAYETIKGVLKWTWGSWVEPGTDSLKTNVSTWWENTALPAIKGAAKWTWGELVVPAWADISQTVSDWWTETSEEIKKIAVMKWEGLEFPSWEDVKSKAEASWKSIKEGLAGLFRIEIGISGFNFIGTAGANVMFENAGKLGSTLVDGATNQQNNIVLNDVITNRTKGVPGLAGVGSSASGVNIGNINISAVPQSTRDLVTELNWSLQNVRFST